MTQSAQAKWKNVEMLVLDVDGVLTTGKIILNDDGNEIKIFDVQDGFGVVLWRRAGFKVAIISARAAPAVTARAKDLGIDRVYQDAHPKTKAYEKLLKEFKLTDDQVCFIGDDLPDICVLNRVGLSVSVPNAASEAKKAAAYITKNKGGCGAVREVVEKILKAKKVWPSIVKSYQ